MSARSSTAGSASGDRASTEAPRPTAPGLVVIGTSFGGLTALQTILPALPATYPRAVVVVQHRSRDSGDALAAILQAYSALPIRDAEDKDPLQAARVYLAPPDYHLLFDDDAIALSTDAAVLYARPSIDVAFASAADAMGPRAVGVLLTGANRDGARGLARIQARGGHTIVQDPASAAGAAMPRAALAALTPDRVLALEAIGPYLAEL